MIKYTDCFVINNKFDKIKLLRIETWKGNIKIEKICKKYKYLLSNICGSIDSGVFL